MWQHGVREGRGGERVGGGRREGGTHCEVNGHHETNLAASLHVVHKGVQRSGPGQGERERTCSTLGERIRGS